MKNIIDFLNYFFKNVMTYINDFLDMLLNFDYIGFLSNIFTVMTFEGFLKLILIYFFIVWIAIIIWVTKDIINRTNNILLQIFSIFTVLLGTPLGIVVYLLIRPSKTLFERFYEEASVEEETEDYEKEEEKDICPHCSYTIKKDYKFCPNCKKCLKRECLSCKKDLEPEWTICPYCGKDQENKIEKILEKKEENLDNKETVEKEIEDKKEKQKKEELPSI